MRRDGGREGGREGGRKGGREEEGREGGRGLIHNFSFFICYSLSMNPEMLKMIKWRRNKSNWN